MICSALGKRFGREPWALERTADYQQWPLGPMVQNEAASRSRNDKKVSQKGGAPKRDGSNVEGNSDVTEEN